MKLELTGHKSKRRLRLLHLRIIIKENGPYHRSDTVHAFQDSKCSIIGTL